MTPDPKIDKAVDKEMMLHRAFWVGRYVAACAQKFIGFKTDDRYVRQYVKEHIC